jgi:hypothetical protein
MHDAPLVGVPESPQEVLRNPQGLTLGRSPCSLKVLSEGRAFDVCHHVVNEPVCIPAIQEPRDVWVIELREETDLTEEPLGGDRDRQLGVEHFERDGASSPIPGEKHPRRPTLCDLAIDGQYVLELIADERK